MAIHFKPPGRAPKGKVWIMGEMNIDNSGPVWYLEDKELKKGEAGVITYSLDINKGIKDLVKYKKGPEQVSRLIDWERENNR